MQKTIKITFKEGTTSEEAQNIIDTRLKAHTWVADVQTVESHFDLIREWAKNKGILKSGSAPVQSLKLMEEAGELAAAVLRENTLKAIDAIGDIVVVLTSIAYFHGVTIEQCIEAAYEEIKGRNGKMVNGDFQKEVPNG